MKKLHIAMSMALVLSILLSLACFDASCDTVRSGVLRLHILANSDSDYDQEVKLKVRDRLLEECGELFEQTYSYDEAVSQAKENLPLLQMAAEAELERLGCDLPVKVEIEKSDFSTRVYEDVTLPAGEYTAVRVLIGDAEGQNWWCVCYPNMCIPAVSQTEEIGSVLDKQSTKIVTNSDKYVVRFKIVEIYQNLKSKFKK